LRSILGNPLQLTIEINGKSEIIGEIDRQSAKKMTHDESIYLHKGTIYHVQALDLEKDLVHLKEMNSPYYTEPVVNTDISIQETLLSANNDKFSICFGDIKVVEQVSGYRKLSWVTNLPLSQYEILIEPDDLLTKGFWIFFSSSVIYQVIRMNLWTNSKINYGNTWKTIRESVIIRDKTSCQVCGIITRMNQLHVHHIKPFREFLRAKDANNPENLITLCPSCHKKAEENVKMRSILAGFGYALLNISPILLNCDVHDLGYTVYENKIASANDQGIILFDQFQGGIGLAENLYTRYKELFSSALDLVTKCSCKQGCPSCVGPPGENGLGAKAGVIQLLQQIVGL